eukprot:gnl/MRDRNA2_/MRDRNA2_41142_c0_seq1.p1 gnl/MRDRNA2_/MRDRNA2_41142_c0~~gnl/MRDRNA2_/MRDRNA2_41142_c0_seq1.p1  ORF type:complete len:397 (+),score=60.12 gnl/MRDRNA2_/MRDRNA2_41142_c0_seq1:85-1275(+)
MRVACLVLCVCDIASLQILSCYYGYSRCIGVPDELMTNATALREMGCVLDANGATNAASWTLVSTMAGAMTQNLGFALHGSKVMPFMDGMPCVFGMDEDMMKLDLQLADISITLTNGTVIQPMAATWGPAVERNEARTLLMLGMFGYQYGVEPAKVVIGNVTYTGPDLSYNGTGPQMVQAQLLPVAEHLAGEKTGTLLDLQPQRVDGGNCGSSFPKTTHVLQAVFSGGLHTKDGIGMPNNTHLSLFTVTLGGNTLASEVLGMSDIHDHDNYLDLCLDLSGFADIRTSLGDGMTLKVTSERDNFEFITGPKGDCMNPLVNSACGDSRTKTQTMNVDVENSMAEPVKHDTEIIDNYDSASVTTTTATTTIDAVAGARSVAVSTMIALLLTTTTVCMQH